MVPKKRKPEGVVVAKSETRANFSNIPDSDVDGSDDDGLAKSPEGAEPVLSHAEKRRKKRDAKRAEMLKDIGDHSKKKRKLKDGSSKAIIDPPADSIPYKRQNSVWVGNLAYKTQQSDLRTFFSGVGEVTRVNMPTKVSTGPGKKPDNRGYAYDSSIFDFCLIPPYRFAYVDFATSEAKIAAIALSEQPLLGRKLLIKDGIHVLS